MAPSEIQGVVPPGAAGAGRGPNLGGMLPNLVISGVAPYVLYQIIRPHVANDATALAISGVFPFCGVAFN